MADPDVVRIFDRLCIALDGAFKITIETAYDLLISTDAAGTFIVTLKNGTPQPTTSSVGGEEKKLGYKYRIFLDWGTGFVWYDSSWPGNPDGEFEVDEDDLKKRHSAKWLQSYHSWKSKYEQAFEEQKCDKDSGQDPFPDDARRKTWLLQGMMLACWLSLQGDVESVEYQVTDVSFCVQKDSIGITLKSFIQSLEE